MSDFKLQEINNMNTRKNPFLFLSLFLIFSITASATTPTVIDDTFTVEAGQTTFLDILANDEDEEDYYLSYCRVTITDDSQLTNGTIAVIGNNLCVVSFTGNSTPGTGQFEYEVCDRDGDCAIGTVTVTTTCMVAEIIAPKTVLCPNERFTFKAFENQQSGVDYDWDFGQGADPLTAVGVGPHVVDYGGVPGMRTVSLTVSSNNCFDETDNLGVTVRDAVVADAGPDRVIQNCSDTVCLGYNTKDHVMYYWRPINFNPLVGDYIVSTVFDKRLCVEPAQSRAYTLIVVDNECTTLDTVKVKAEVPDLSVILNVSPNNISGVSTINIAMEIFELNGFPSSSIDPIIVRIPSDPRYMFTWDPTLTQVGFVTVDNSEWTYIGNNGFIHEFSCTNVIPGGGTKTFGVIGLYDPQNTAGGTTITATVVPLSGGDCNATNNTDPEILVYFN